MQSADHKYVILVTGANGQLAREITKISSNYPENNFLFATKEELSLEDAEALELFFERNQINYCINCAAYTAVDKAESEKEKAFLINSDAVGVLAGICKIHKSKLIHISTDYVYDDSLQIPLKEESAVAPVNVYGQSKLNGEEMALKINPSTLIIRTSWVYSSFGNNFVKTMLRLFNEKEEINVVNDQFGSPTYAADLAEVIMVFVEEMKQGKDFSGIVNYCNTGVTTWFDFASEIKLLVKSNCNINPIPSSFYKTAAARPRYSVLDTSKIKGLLQLQIPSWKDSLKKCLDILKVD